MRRQFFVLILGVLCAVGGVVSVAVHSPLARRIIEKEDHAMDMFDWWYGQRALPNDFIPPGAYAKAATAARSAYSKRRASSADAVTTAWTSLGPNNIGGRILALAVDPANPSTVWAGSASGGLWKSTTGGQGASAWSYVNTGYTTISVSAIAIDPTNSGRMYIGTGELSFYHSGLVGTPGARSSYGVGILKSTDGGATWTQTNLAWQIPQVTAVQKIVINPLNPLTLFAATSEGVYKSTNAGDNWTQSSSNLMAMDMAMSPDDTNTVYVAYGNLNSTLNPGIYKTVDAGTTWAQLTSGLPTSNFGRTALGVTPSFGAVVYAGISNGDPNNGGIIGLYKSTNHGITWTQMSTVNYVSAQGWYDNVVAVNPGYPDSVYCAGLDIYLSTSGGISLTRISDWTAGYLGTIAPGGSEGSSNYAHADHHAIAFDPVHRKTMYFGTDGGVFKSTDGGMNFFGVNGGLATTQFYNGFVSSYSDSTIALGGLQDNGVIKFQGTATWRKVDGGDGGWNAIDPTNPSILYDEYVYLQLSKSTNGGASFTGINNGLPSGSTYANFIAPFVISHANPNVLYAGTQAVYKTTNGGDSWTATNSGANLNGTKVSALAVSFTSPDTLMAATGSSASQSPVFQVFVTTNGGTTWSNVTGSLPARYPTDIEFDPSSSTTAYVTFSGYGTAHVFRTTNLGQTWTNITTGADVPHQSIAVDPDDPSSLYAGTDLGVYHSSDDGASWEPFFTGMPAAMVLDLSISYQNRTIRAATFGNGVYERKLVQTPRISVASPSAGDIFSSGQIVQIVWSEKFVAMASVDFSADSGKTWTQIADSIPASTQSFTWTVPDTATTLGMIRVRESSTGTPSDISSGTFTILRYSDVNVGWNLLSLQLTPADARKSVLFPTASSSAFIYQGGYMAEDTLQAGRGFWLKFDAPYSFDFTGDSVTAETIAVQAGWNMIGGLSVAVPVSTVVSVPDSLISSSYFGYHGGYIVADSLYPKKGYWAKAKTSGQLIVQRLPGQVPKARPDPPPLAVLSFSDAAGGRQVLALTDYRPAVERSVLPPPPPEPAFDVRFFPGQMSSLVTPGGPGIQTFCVGLQGVRFPLRVRVSSLRLQGTLTLRASGDATPLRPGEEIVITSPADGMTVEYASTGTSSALPSSFVLERNYPNPFNPSTTIRYAMPADGKVTLAVFNTLGQTVATLADGFQSSGWHEVSFDAANLPSGIYFARLSAQTPTGSQHVATIKMALVR